MAPSQSNYPIPYGSSECRKMLFNLLKTLLYNNKPGCLPPLQQAIVIFSRGVQDHDLEVRFYINDYNIASSLVDFLSYYNYILQHCILQLQRKYNFKTLCNVLYLSLRFLNYVLKLK